MIKTVQFKTVGLHPHRNNAMHRCPSMELAILSYLSPEAHLDKLNRQERGGSSKGWVG